MPAARQWRLMPLCPVIDYLAALLTAPISKNKYRAAPSSYDVAGADVAFAHFHQGAFADVVFG